MILGRFHHQSGIALGSILFILAIIAFLAAAIAAGSGGFNANTGTENAKAMAETLITSCDDYSRALQMVTMNNGCDPTAIDWTPDGGYPTGSTALWQHGDYTGGNGTNRAGNGQCALFDPRGGGMIFKPYPSTALASPKTGAYTAENGGWAGNDGGVNEDAYGGYPLIFGEYCLPGLGTCPLITTGANGTISMYVQYINYATCQQINKALNISWDPNSTTVNPGGDSGANVLGGINVRNAPGPVYQGGASGQAPLGGVGLGGGFPRSSGMACCITDAKKPSKSR